MTTSDIEGTVQQGRGMQLSVPGWVLIWTVWVTAWWAMKLLADWSPFDVMLSGGFPEVPLTFGVLGDTWR
jgi:hypothetical protein